MQIISSPSAELFHFCSGLAGCANSRPEANLRNRSAKVLPSDNASAAIYDRLLGLNFRVGAMDWRLAASARARDLAVLMRNLRNYGRVPGLSVEDRTRHGNVSGNLRCPVFLPLRRFVVVLINRRVGRCSSRGGLPELIREAPLRSECFPNLFWKRFPVHIDPRIPLSIARTILHL